MHTPESNPQLPPHMNVTPSNALPTARKSKCGLFAALGCGIPVLILILLIVLASITGGSKSTSNKASSGSTQKNGEAITKAALPRYVGQWTGADGTLLWIRGDGKGDFNSGSSKVSGGGVTIDESDKKLAITSFFGIGKTWQLDSVPKTTDGQTEMTLNGVRYRRTTGFDTNQGDSPTEFDEDAPPPVKEQKRLVRETLTSFDQALGTKDFTAFYNQTSKAWRNQTNPTELREAFKVFIDKKFRLKEILKTLPISIKTAQMEDGLLVLKGTFASEPNKTHFKLRYTPEDGAWKLFSIQVKVGDPITD